MTPRMRRNAGLVTVGLLACAVLPGCGEEPAPAPPSPPDPRVSGTILSSSEFTAALRGVELPSGDSVDLELHPESGEVRWSGATVRPETLPWGGVAIVPQSLGLVEELTVRENVELPIRLGGSPTVGGPEGQVEALLAALGLATLADRLPAETSLGEQQRTALARALVLEPRLLVADEPTGHQDVVWTRGVLSVLRRAADGGTACLIATHHRALVRYADRVLGIRDGEIGPVDPDEVAAGDEL